jgi:hypothetical protein
MNRLVLEGKYPIARLPLLFEMDPLNFAVQHIKEMGVDAKLFCLNFAPFILRISVFVISLDETLV